MYLSTSFKSSIPGFVDYMKKVAKNNPRLILKSKLTKEEYYLEVLKSKVQFNSALQDYVSWTLIESTMLDCDVCYPNFRSFPEILPADRMYRAFDVDSAVEVLETAIHNPRKHPNVSTISDIGRQLEAYIMLNDVGDQEFNVWAETEYSHKLINNENNRSR